MTEKADVFYLTFDGSDRDLRMQERFKKLDLHATKIAAHRSNDGCMLGHLEMIKTFLQTSTKEFGVFLEEDVYIHKEFKGCVDKLTGLILEKDLDILLIGYLMTHAPYGCHWLQQIAEKDGITIHSYPEDTWGTQGYILTRPYAMYIYNKYNKWYMDNCETYSLAHFKSDWTIVKRGKRALIYPMLCIEEGDVVEGHAGQTAFHRGTTDFHYKPDLYY
jgi:GR25 family glycosyltransferase involved in LPS biosynthesis